MLGDSLLVAPIFRPDGVVDYYLPDGRWTHFLSGAVVEGGHWQRETHDYLSLPLLVRANSVIAVGADEGRPDYAYADGVTFHVFELADGATATAQVPNPQGATVLSVTVARRGATIHAHVAGATPSWRLLLRGIDRVASVEGGSAQAGAQGTLLTPPPGATALTIRLPED
jgi:alpha-D-xyloside xylohydrolase